MHNHLFHMAIDWMNKLNLPFLSPFMWPQKHLGCVQSLLKERERKEKKKTAKRVPRSNRTFWLRNRKHAWKQERKKFFLKWEWEIDNSITENNSNHFIYNCRLENLAIKRNFLMGHGCLVALMS